MQKKTVIIILKSIIWQNECANIQLAEIFQYCWSLFDGIVQLSYFKSLEHKLR